jgi:hypothetical protein
MEQNHHQFFTSRGDPYIPVEAIRGWLTEAECNQAIELLLTYRDAAVKAGTDREPG